MERQKAKTFGCAWPSKKLPRGDHAEVTPIPPPQTNESIPDSIMTDGNVATRPLSFNYKFDIKDPQH